MMSCQVARLPYLQQTNALHSHFTPDPIAKDRYSAAVRILIEPLPQNLLGFNCLKDGMVSSNGRLTLKFDKRSSRSSG
jgi:hypothetical protein